MIGMVVFYKMIEVHADRLEHKPSLVTVLFSGFLYSVFVWELNIRQFFRPAILVLSLKPNDFSE